MKITDEFSAANARFEIARLRNLFISVDAIARAGDDLEINVDLPVEDLHLRINRAIDEREDDLAEWNRRETETAP